MGLGDDVGDREGLAGAGHAQQDLVVFVGVHPRDEFRDGGGLIALGLILRDEVEADVAFALFRPFGAMGDIGPFRSSDDGMAGEQRLTVQHSLGRVGAFCGAGQEGVEGRGQGFAGHGGTRTGLPKGRQRRGTGCIERLVAFAEARGADRGFGRRRRGFARALAGRAGALGLGRRFGRRGHGGSMESLGQTIKPLEFSFRSDYAQLRRLD